MVPVVQTLVSVGPVLDCRVGDNLDSRNDAPNKERPGLRSGVLVLQVTLSGGHQLIVRILASQL